MRAIKRVALLGGGVIGAGWAARLLINNIDVVMFDPCADAQSRTKQVIAKAVCAYEKLFDFPVAARGQLSFVDDPTAAADGADFIQESAPERLEIKRELFASVTAITADDVIIASSSSGLLPSAMQNDMRFPERILVAHPFNPVYLLPLVEIVGGEKTSSDAKNCAAQFYKSIGMHPLLVRKEIDAYISDRLLESVWREGLHLIKEGVATADEIDQAICYGPGLRWAFMGNFLTYRIAGGAGGMRHFMKQFAPSLKWPWARFEGPDMDAELLDQLSTQSDAQAAGMSIAELEKQRDDALVAVLKGLQSCNRGAGATINHYAEKLRL